ncbi:hypothetical protein GCM10010363_58810 [Streptomyces omiyaensis]|nr:hypothetical protein GCM10010363_58810 [Streptomyces omiyaensis]
MDPWSPASGQTASPPFREGFLRMPSSAPPRRLPPHPSRFPHLRQDHLEQAGRTEHGGEGSGRGRGERTGETARAGDAGAGGAGAGGAGRPAPDDARPVAGVLRVRLSGGATFLRLPKVLDALEALPRDRPVEVDPSGLHHLDRACRAARTAWAERHAAAGSHPVRLLPLPDRPPGTGTAPAPSAAGP